MSDTTPTSPGSNPEQDPRSSDYRAPEKSVTRMHASLEREKIEPQEGAEPIPLWLITFFFLIFFWSGGYLFCYSGGFRGDIFDETQVTWGLVQAGGTAVQNDPIAKGKKLFTANCAVCHQATGLGIEGQYPPLAGSEIVLSKDGFGPNHIARIVLNGISGPIQVKGKNYNNSMPPQNHLKDDQLAAILTYVRQEWGNSAPAITAEGIAAVRAEVASRTQQWSFTELKAIPAAELPAGKAPAPAPAAK